MFDVPRALASLPLPSTDVYCIGIFHSGRTREHKNKLPMVHSKNEGVDWREMNKVQQQLLTNSNYSKKKKNLIVHK